MPIAMILAAGLAFSVGSSNSTSGVERVGSTSGVAPTKTELKAQGSDSTLKVVKDLATAYAAQGGATVQTEGGGSGKGIKACQDGQVPLAFSSRGLKDEEKKAGLVATEYGYDAVAIIVHKSNPIEELTLEQLRDIFTGKTETWTDGKPVTAFNRNADSGTYEMFKEAVLGKEGKFTDKAVVKHDGVLLSTVAKVPTAIAFTSAGELNDTVKVVKIDGVLPSAETVRNKRYLLTRTLYFVTKGEATGEAQAFIDYAKSEKGQRVLAEHKLIPLKGTAVAGAGESK
jgi:phosphate transport system substrate-binding protein